VAAMSSSEPTQRLVDPRAVRITIVDTMDRPVGPSPIELEPPAAARAPVRVRLEHRDDIHAVLVEDSSDDPSPVSVLLLPIEPAAGRAGTLARREIIVDGWRFEVDVESAWRASLRARARRDDAMLSRSGPTDLRAVIPGRILSVQVVQGDAVVAGQQLLVIEAMKMQNELRAPRDGVVARVDAAPGRTIEVGELLLALE
jgi:biotin carboxyl carrier protein